MRYNFVMNSTQKSQLLAPHSSNQMLKKRKIKGRTLNKKALLSLKILWNPLVRVTRIINKIYGDFECLDTATTNWRLYLSPWSRWSVLVSRAPPLGRRNTTPPPSSCHLKPTRRDPPLGDVSIAPPILITKSTWGIRGCRNWPQTWKNPLLLRDIYTLMVRILLLTDQSRSWWTKFEVTGPGSEVETNSG